MPRIGKYDKELDWLVPDPLVYQHWEKHASFKIIQKYSSILTGRIADFGCNNGVQCCMLSNLPGVESVIGFDISEHAINDGRRVIRNHIKCSRNKIEFWQCNLTDNDYDKRDIDAGICFHTLEHIYPEDLDSVLTGIHRVLKPGGNLVFSMPCRDAFKNAKAHVSFFDLKDGKYINLTKLLERNGCRVIDIYEDSTLDAHQQLCITGVACTV